MTDHIEQPPLIVLPADADSQEASTESGLSFPSPPCHDETGTVPVKDDAGDAVANLPEPHVSSTIAEQQTPPIGGRTGSRGSARGTNRGDPHLRMIRRPDETL